MNELMPYLASAGLAALLGVFCMRGGGRILVRWYEKMGVDAAMAEDSAHRAGIGLLVLAGVAVILGVIQVM